MDHGKDPECQERREEVKGSWDAALLEVFSQALSQVAEEMGVVLGRSGRSPNIKERRDYSCALFSARGELLAQAAHIPVHLGSLPLSMDYLVRHLRSKGRKPREGDVYIWNDPFSGGTHLPDITMAAPYFLGHKLMGFGVVRAHHSDVGGRAPGSMPVGEEVYQEGLIIPLTLYAEGGRVKEEVEELILANTRTPEERKGDLRAQMGALMVGARRFRALVEDWGEDFEEMERELLDYAERLTRETLGELEGEYEFVDYLDDDGKGREDININVKLTFKDGHMTADFRGTHPEVEGPLNCPPAVTHSAVYYVLRCLLPPHAPFNQGCLRRVRVVLPEKSLVNASWPRAVAGGNVETSQRIVDALLGALSRALPDRIPAASYGTMTNFSFGGTAPRPFAYYETIAGGCGARPGKDGLDATHNHMTNTMNTPVEALEFYYPVRVLEYSIREGSGGKGLFRGGDGVRRKFLFLERASVSLLADRRRRGPYGLNGGEPGEPGEDYLVEPDGRRTRLPSKVELKVKPGDVIELNTPGGGGWGKEG